MEILRRSAMPCNPETEQERAGLSTLGIRVDGALKRVLDVVVAVLALLLLSPLLVIAAVAIKLDSPGPVFFRVRRIGHRGRELRMLKFRKMHEGASGPALTTADDERFTALGRLLAATKLDELPQLWHVLTGEMSLVGPRPEDPEFVAVHPAAYREILRVRPGITGLSQLAFAREGAIPVEGDRSDHYVERLLPQKVAMDVLYAVNRTLVMDARIMLWTLVAIVLRRDVAVHRRSAALNLRRRPQVPAREEAPLVIPNERSVETA